MRYEIAGENHNVRAPETAAFLLHRTPAYQLVVELVSPASRYADYAELYTVLLRTPTYPPSR